MKNKKKSNVLLLTSSYPREETPDSVSIPLGLSIVKHNLIKNGHNCEVFDPDLYPDLPFLEKFANKHYNVVGIGVTHWNMEHDLNMLHSFKKIAKEVGIECLYIAGGQSATINHKDFLEGGFDIVCLGYSENSIAQIAEEYVNKNTKKFYDSISDISGITFTQPNGSTIFNPSESLSKEYFEDLLFHQVLEMDIPYQEYWDFMRPRTSDMLTMNSRSYVIENGRLFTVNRCLANCGFCSCPDFFTAASNVNISDSTNRGPFLALNAEQVVSLIKNQVDRYGAKAFSFNDEDFLVGSKVGIKRAKDICNLILEHKNNGGLPHELKFSCQTRASNFFIKDENRNEILDIELLKLLKETNFHNVSFGIETFSDRLITSPSINKPAVTSWHYHTVLEAMLDLGLYPTINLILGTPESTVDELLDTIWQSLRYIERPCQFSVETLMLSFPGAGVFNRDGYPTKGVTWKNPINKKEIYIPTYYIPHDKTIRKMLETLEDDSRIEYEKLKINYGLEEDKLFPRTATALCHFKAAAKFLGNNKLLKKVDEKMEALLSDAISSSEARIKDDYVNRRNFTTHSINV